MGVGTTIVIVMGILCMTFITVALIMRNTMKEDQKK